MKKIFTGTLLLILIGFASVAPVDAKNTPGGIVYLTNNERSKIGLPELEVNPLLEMAAEAKANAIFEKQRFVHNFSELQFYDFADAVGYKYDVLGENLAIDFTSDSIVVQKWMESPTHKKNLLNRDYEEIGVAVKTDIMNGKNTTVVVQFFGKPTDALTSTPMLIAGNTPSAYSSFKQGAVLVGLNLIGVGILLSFAMYSYDHRKVRVSSYQARVHRKI